jgi:hypothetical protein
MISMSSLVIAAWRDRLYSSVSLVDHVAGVARRIVHRGHARALFRGRVLEQRGEDLHGDVARQQIGEDRVLLRLVLVAAAAAASSPLRLVELRRDDLVAVGIWRSPVWKRL